MGPNLANPTACDRRESDKPLVEALSGGVLSGSASVFIAERLGWVTWVVVSDVDSGMMASEREAALEAGQAFLYLFRGL